MERSFRSFQTSDAPSDVAKTRSMPQAIKLHALGRIFAYGSVHPSFVQET